MNALISMRWLAIVVLATMWPAESGTDGIDLRSRIERAAAREAHRAVAPPDRFEILSVRLMGAAPVEADDVELRVAEVEGPNTAGYVRVRFALVADGTPRGDARATVRGLRRGPAVVTVETLRMGESIHAGALRVEDVDLTRLVAPPLREIATVAGKAPVRSLGAGRIVTQALVRTAPVVRRGDTVDLVVRRPGLAVRAKGIVRRDGAPGDTVTVRNLTTGSDLVAVVELDGTLVVERGP